MGDRTPKNLQALLKFAMGATKSEDAPNSVSLVEMDKERRKFLEEVLNSMTVDTAEELQKILGILQSSSSSDEDKIEAMELLREFVDDIDHANSFVKLGGAKVLISFLESNNVDMKNAAASLIADLSQNNPLCQSEFGIDKIFLLLIDGLSDDLTSSGAMRAISCLVRHHEKALSSFIGNGGLECLAEAITSNAENIVIKSCFLVSSLASEFPYIRDQLIDRGTIETLSSNLKANLDNPVKSESILCALLSLTRCPVGKTHLRKTNLERILKELIHLSLDKPEFEEIEEYSNELLNFFQI